ncbi:Splicing regulatory glutamine/lysine-rich protein 1 [Triticum urartu]|uniref:Splicing regulatory glutamine/lysine-rich protein 1 n=1 Tax=Triticum urartu TaxID=4572 RepID=M7ZJM9_TRIUA|nr:Splicing regulatory glutamine/lysine-rich protein 1 [Triticum urartu]
MFCRNIPIFSKIQRSPEILVHVADCYCLEAAPACLLHEDPSGLIVTEEQLAALFINVGQVVDCRMCGDPNSVLRFAFIEFTDEEGARAALNLSGTVLGYYPVRVLPSKTAIAPVNPTFLPRSDDEREMCARTIYCTNIDKKVSQADVKLFFESICGEVYRLRLLGDYQHNTRIAFVEFVMAESATAALNCSGVILGSLPIRLLVSCLLLPGKLQQVVYLKNDEHLPLCCANSVVPLVFLFADAYALRVPNIQSAHEQFNIILGLLCKYARCINCMLLVTSETGANAHKARRRFRLGYDGFCGCEALYLTENRMSEPKRCYCFQKRCNWERHFPAQPNAS